MGLTPSGFSLAGTVNTLLRIPTHRSARRVEPESQTLPADSPVLTTIRTDRRRLFRAKFWKRSRKRNYSTSESRFADDYENVFGVSRLESTRSFPAAVRVRSLPECPISVPLQPTAEQRVVPNVEVKKKEAPLTCPFPHQTRSVPCRYCRNAFSACLSAATSPCPTPRPCPFSQTACRACWWEYPEPRRTDHVSTTTYLDYHDRFVRETSSTIVTARSTGRPVAGTISVQTTVTVEPEPRPVVKWEPAPLVIAEPEVKPVFEPEPQLADVVKEPVKSESPPCVCARPVRPTCPCDKKLFESMHPWNKWKSAAFVVLILGFMAWLLAFIIV